MIKYLACLFMMLLVACNDSGSSASFREPEKVPEELPEKNRDMSDFLLVESDRDTVILGTDLESAWLKERPKMSVLLEYDFYIGKKEVSCREYRSLMKGGAADDCDMALPVAGMSFYDAVLYANALSKSEGLDTAYTYTDRTFDSRGRCTNLVGFRFLPEVEAYRLPTEAEWVKVASREYKPEDGWNRDNAEFQSHESCTADVSKQGVCDMAGNLKEWVNDWFGVFKDTTLVNYLGSPNGGSLGEHVIKGGCYNTAAANSHVYNRGDVYTVSASTYEGYVGFRLAFGKIPNGVWMGNNGFAVTGNSAILTTAQGLFHQLGTANAKLAFRDNLSGNLVYVDFFDANPQIVEIADSLEVYHPDISPDGQWVVFCTGLEGTESKSSVYVRQLDSKGTGLIRLEDDNAAIPRFRVTAAGDTVVVYVSSAENNKDDVSFKKHSTWQVPFSRGRFGTPEKLFDGAYHGGISSDNKLAVTGARLLRARIAEKNKTILANSALDSVWYEGEQACNASLSKDYSKRTLFLDFGSKVGQKFAGTQYGIHERMLIVDSTGKLIQTVSAPKGYSFDHTEWTVESFLPEDENQKYAVATLSNANGAHEKIVLVNLQDSSVMDLIEGEDLYHPCLWTNATKNSKMDKSLDLDSAGIYFSEKFLLTDALWRFKMELFWQFKDSARVLVMGSSRPLNGFRSRLLDSAHFSLNTSQTPNTIFTTRDFLKNYGFTHLKKLKYVVVSLDLDFWGVADDETQNFFKGDYKSYPGFVFDKNHGFWKSGYPEGLYERTRNAIGTRVYDQYIPEQGFFPGACTTVWDSVPAMDGDTVSCSDSELLQSSVDALQEIIDVAADKDVVVIGVIFPQSPFYKETGAFGRHGLRRSSAEKLIDQLKEMDDANSNFILMDENQMGDHDYEARHFGDYDHLCYTGAAKLTRRVESVILELEKE